MILLIALIFFTGFLSINAFCKKINLLDLLILSFPLGVITHTIIYMFLSFVGIYYSQELFIIISLLCTLFLLRRKCIIEKNLKQIPVYYIIFLTFILVRLLMMATTGFFEFYNYDEFTAYQTGSTIISLSHDFTEMYQTYAPINYFLGTMSIEFLGLSVTNARIFSVIFFGLTSLFIYSSLRQNNVNKHISALLSMIFLVSSSELLSLSKSFYTNIFFMFYFVAGIYGLIYHYIIKNENKIPYLWYFMLIGAFLTRREVMYFVIVLLILLSIYLFVNKKLNIKQIFIFNLPLFFPFLWTIMEKIYSFKYGWFANPENQGTIIERIFERLNFDKFSQFLNSVYNQTLSNDYYYFNTLIFAMLIVTLTLLIIMLIKKNKNKIYIKFSTMFMICELLYIGIILFTEFVMFTENEYLLAASFSRYILPVLASNFIILGCLLFNNTDKKNKSDSVIEIQEVEKKIKVRNKITKPRVLLIIPAYNEEENIVNTVNTIINYNSNKKNKYDYIVINDGSTDNTETVLLENNIKHIKLVHNLGIGGCVQTGYKYAYNHDYDIAVQFDGDGQHDVNYVEKIIKPIMNGDADFVIGSRFIDSETDTFKSSFIRRIGIKVISLTMKIMTGKIIYDTTSGFRACNKNIIREFSLNYPVEYPEPISTVDILKQKYEVKEIQVSMNERVGGISSITSWKSVYYMINVFISIIVVGLRRKK